MKIENIYLDMDGVLSDFVHGALQAHNKPDPWINNPSNRGFYDMAMLWGLSATDFWKPIREDISFWQNLPLCEHAEGLMDILSDTLPFLNEGFTLQIATSPIPYSPTCHSGKIHWLMENFNHLVAGTIFINKKQKLANPTSLLIDDSESNIKSFKKAGGQTILYPRLWNSNHRISDDPNTYVKQQLRILGFKVA